MKTTSLVIIILSLLVFASCKKNSPAISYPYGSWSLNNTTFKVTSCTTDSAGADLVALDSLTGNPSCDIIVYFNSALPAASGSYTVADQGTLPAAGQVSITVGYAAPSVLNNYISTGGGGNQKVNVTVSGGKISISGTGIELVNIGLGTDSTALTFNITQTQ
jgi:hypothetical protein